MQTRRSSSVSLGRWVRRLGTMVVSAMAILILVAKPLPPDGMSLEVRVAEARAVLKRTLVAQPPISPGNSLLAGWARVELVPPLEWQVPLAGNRQLRFTRARGSRPESVWVRGVALRQGDARAILLSADLLVISPELAERTLAAIRRQIPIDASDLMLVATHTHSGPGGYWEGLLAEWSVGPYQERIRDFLVERLARAAVEAWSRTGEVEVSVAQIEVGAAVRNRVYVGGPKNPMLGIVRLERIDGGGRLDLLNYSAHSTNFLKGDGHLTGDYPALMETLVQDPGHELLFTPGSIGDQKPYFIPRIRDGERRAHTMADYLVHEGLEKAVFEPLDDVTLESVEFEVDLPALRPRVFRSGVLGSWALRPWVIRRLFPSHLDRGTIQIVRIGSVALIGAPADLASSVALPLLDQAQASGLKVFFASMSEEWVGYVLLEEEYRDRDYKEMTQFHGSESGPFFAGLYGAVIERLAKRVAGETRPDTP